jgi:hypothetical protein
MTSSIDAISNTVTNWPSRSKNILPSGQERKEQKKSRNDNAFCPWPK